MEANNEEMVEEVPQRVNKFYEIRLFGSKCVEGRSKKPMQLCLHQFEYLGRVFLVV
jgi:hypothetical protein